MTKKELKNRETMIWEGQSPLNDFVKISRELKYKYVILCEPNFHSDEDLGAACRDAKELAKVLLEFTERGFFYTVVQIN